MNKLKPDGVKQNKSKPKEETLEEKVARLETELEIIKKKGSFSDFNNREKGRIVQSLKQSTGRKLQDLLDIVDLKRSTYLFYVKASPYISSSYSNK